MKSSAMLASLTTIATAHTFTGHQWIHVSQSSACQSNRIQNDNTIAMATSWAVPVTLPGEHQPPACVPPHASVPEYTHYQLINTTAAIAVEEIACGKDPLCLSCALTPRRIIHHYNHTNSSMLSDFDTNLCDAMFEFVVRSGEIGAAQNTQPHSVQAHKKHSRQELVLDAITWGVWAQNSSGFVITTTAASSAVSSGVNSSEPLLATVHYIYDVCSPLNATHSIVSKSANTKGGAVRIHQTVCSGTSCSENCNGISTIWATYRASDSVELIFVQMPNKMNVSLVDTSSAIVTTTNPRHQLVPISRNAIALTADTAVATHGVDDRAGALPIALIIFLIMSLAFLVIIACVHGLGVLLSRFSSTSAEMRLLPNAPLPPPKSGSVTVLDMETGLERRYSQSTGSRVHYDESDIASGVGYTDSSRVASISSQANSKIKTGSSGYKTPVYGHTPVSQNTSGSWFSWLSDAASGLMSVFSLDGSSATSGIKPLQATPLSAPMRSSRTMSPSLTIHRQQQSHPPTISFQSIPNSSMGVPASLTPNDIPMSKGPIMPTRQPSISITPPSPAFQHEHAIPSHLPRRAPSAPTSTMRRAIPVTPPSPPYSATMQQRHPHLSAPIPLLHRPRSKAVSFAEPQHNHEYQYQNDLDYEHIVFTRQTDHYSATPHHQSWGTANFDPHAPTMHVSATYDDGIETASNASSSYSSSCSSNGRCSSMGGNTTWDGGINHMGPRRSLDEFEFHPPTNTSIAAAAATRASIPYHAYHPTQQQQQHQRNNIDRNHSMHAPCHHSTFAQSYHPYAYHPTPVASAHAPTHPPLSYQSTHTHYCCSNTHTPVSTHDTYPDSPRTRRYRRQTHLGGPLASRPTRPQSVSGTDDRSARRTQSATHRLRRIGE